MHKRKCERERERKNNFVVKVLRKGDDCEIIKNINFFFFAKVNELAGRIE
jgi:hypothetical protein